MVRARPLQKVALHGVHAEFPQHVERRLVFDALRDGGLVQISSTLGSSLSRMRTSSRVRSDSENGSVFMLGRSSS